MSKLQAVKLVLENFQMVDDVSKFIDEELQHVLFEKVDEVIESKSDDYDWIGKFNFSDNDNAFWAPKEWLSSGEYNGEKGSEFFCAYYLGFESWEKKDSTDVYWKCHSLFDNPNNKMVMGFYSWYKMPKKEWKNFIAAEGEKHKLRELGFEYNSNDGGWYLPIAPLNKQLVIDNYEDSLEDAMLPISETMDKLKELQPIFDEIVTAFKKKFAEA